MAQERRIVIQVIRAFLNSFWPKQPKLKFIGEDCYGTKYYEDPNAPSRRGRSCVPVDCHPESGMWETPDEWESWLRYRRRDPPTAEEMKANLQIMMMKKENAAKLEQEYNEERKAKHAKEGKPLETSQPTLSFPTYDEYRHYGSGYTPKISNK